MFHNNILSVSVMSQQLVILTYFVWIAVIVHILVKNDASYNAAK